MSDGVAIHCTFPALAFDAAFRVRLERCFVGIGMQPCSFTRLHETPPPEHTRFKVAAHYFPRTERAGTLKFIDWTQPGEAFQPGDSVEVLFVGFPGAAETDHYWRANLHFSEGCCIGFISILTQVEVLASYDDDDKKAWAALRKFVADLHQSFLASSTQVKVSGEAELETLFEYRAGTNDSIPGAHPIP